MPLPAGEPCALRGKGPQGLFQHPRQVLRQPLAQGSPDGLLPLPDRGPHLLHVAKLHVFPDGEGILSVVLEHHAEMPPERIRGHLRYILSVYEDMARVRLVEPAQQLHQGGLSGTVVPYQGCPRPGGHGEAHVPEGRLLPPRVGEGHMLEADALPRCLPGSLFSGQGFLFR